MADIEREAERQLMIAMGLPTGFGGGGGQRTQKRRKKPRHSNRRDNRHGKNITPIPSAAEVLALCYVAPPLFSSGDGNDSNESDEQVGRESIPASKSNSVRTEAEIFAPFDSALSKQLYGLKERFSAIGGRDFRRARDAANVYECVGAGPFVCRSAMKLVELDAQFGLGHRAATLSAAASASEGGNSDTVGTCDDEVTKFTFGDLCGGPGGFSEYLLWRYGTTGVQGWGITLSGECTHFSF